ncbi:MlaD family protein [Flavobacterium sp. JP2137]|uniref:MlaD family protein n=1 Tax=Flavobacterium sp. JP2137 TaxID=3414510 RepID=UPI003D2FC81D
MKISREIKTAILVLSAIMLFIWGYSFLKGKSLFDNSVKYYVLYDNVEGLTTSSHVTLNGLVVGKVSKITIQENTGKLIVEISMTNPFDLSKSTVAYIYSPGLIGGKQIGLEPNFNDKTLALSGDYLDGQIRMAFTDQLGEQLDPLQKKLELVLENANKMLASVNAILDEQAQQDIKNTLGNLNNTLANVNSITKNLDGLVVTNSVKLNSTMNNLSNASGNFSKLSDSLTALDINGTFAKLESASNNIDQIMGGIERGEGSVGKLLKDEQLYSNLNQASKELEELLRDLKLNPKRYVHFSLFGKKAKTFTPSEAEAATPAKE